MISHKYKCIYIHQRKTAGCSIINSFGITPDQAEFHIYNEGVLSYSRRHGRWEKDRSSIYKDYFIFTSIRNPWDRFISAWKYFPQYRHLPLNDLLLNLPRSPQQFISHRIIAGIKKKTGDSDLLRFVETLYFCSFHRKELRAHRHMLRPQLDILIDKNGKFVPDFILRYENLQEDYTRLCKILGKKDVGLPHVNATKHEYYVNYYDEVSQNAVKKLFQKDIDYFGYEFERKASINPPS